MEGCGDGRDGTGGEAVGLEDGVHERVRLARRGADQGAGFLDGDAVGFAVDEERGLADWFVAREDVWRKGEVLFTLGAYVAAQTH